MRWTFLFLLLGGCALRTPVAMPVSVKVPVEVTCNVQTPQEPDWNANHFSKDADALAKLKALLADLELSHGYIGELKAELVACS